MNSPHHPLSALLLCGLLLLIANAPVHAGSATWNLNPTSGDWNTSANWTPEVVPNGPADTASFDLSNITDVTVSASTTVDGIIFNPGASAFTITPSPSHLLTFDGTGIVNNSGVPQIFVSPSTTPLKSISFHNQATAGSNTFFNNLADGIGQGNVDFYNDSTAGTATFTNYGLDGSLGGSTFFFDQSSAAEGTFINTGAPAGTAGGNTIFFDDSTAANATIICNGGVFPSIGGGYTEFFSDAGNATVIANGGTGPGTEGGLIEFFGGNPANATLIAFGGTDGGEGGSIVCELLGFASTARVELFGNGHLTLVGVTSVKVGSIEGDGDVFLGTTRLTVGESNLDTTFSGRLMGAGNNRGSLTKAGTGTLILTNANTYTGGTTVIDGRLVVNSINGSGTGSGAVRVSAGTLAGRGTIAGAVTVGTDAGSGAALGPGRRGGKPDSLTIQSTLTFNPDATYNCGLNTKSAKADQVVANGVTINGAQFSLLGHGGLTLPAGTVLTVINNTATTPIAGTFANLPDGSTFTTHGNTFQANYTGGDGNDLTLTVVP